MSQQINLYGRRFLPVRDPLPSSWLLGIALAAVLLIAALWAWNAWCIQQARSDLQSTRTLLVERQSLLAERSRAVAIARVDPQLARDLQRTEALYRARVELMKLLESGVLGTPGGFSEHMGAFARQSVDGLWLTGFSLSATRIELRGRARTADLVPAYLVRLGSEKVLSGTVLNTLRIGAAVHHGDALSIGELGRRLGAPTSAADPASIEFLIASEADTASRQARQ